MSHVHSYLSTLTHVHSSHVHSYLSTLSANVIRPTQSIIHVPLQVNRFQKSILLILENKCLKSCSEDFILQNHILRTRTCGTGFITQSSWSFHFRQISMIGWKCLVPHLYQFLRGISGRPALEYFYMIHRGRRMGWL